MAPLVPLLRTACHGDVALPHRSKGKPLPQSTVIATSSSGSSADFSYPLVAWSPTLANTHGGRSNGHAGGGVLPARDRWHGRIDLSTSSATCFERR
jgi:hypothetical protein